MRPVFLIFAIALLSIACGAEAATVPDVSGTSAQALLRPCYAPAELQDAPEKRWNPMDYVN